MMISFILFHLLLHLVVIVLSCVNLKYRWSSVIWIRINNVNHFFKHRPLIFISLEFLEKVNIYVVYQSMETDRIKLSFTSGILSHFWSFLISVSTILIFDKYFFHFITKFSDFKLTYVSLFKNFKFKNWL